MALARWVHEQYVLNYTIYSMIYCIMIRDASSSYLYPNVYSVVFHKNFPCIVSNKSLENCFKILLNTLFRISAGKNILVVYFKI